MVIGTDLNRQSELKAFDDTKAGVKGLVDAGVKKLPNIFIHQQDNEDKNTVTDSPGEVDSRAIPTINLHGFSADPVAQSSIVGKIREACETWGFFQAVNHGIPVNVLDEMMDGMKRFHELDNEVKKQMYTRDPSRKVKFVSSFDLFQTPTASWRDTFACDMAPVPPDAQLVPEICRDIVFKFSEHIMEFTTKIMELISEGLGLNPDHLKYHNCSQSLLVMGHYYPACPEPELAMGTLTHRDSGVLAVVLQDQISGLQVEYENRWFDITPVPGALIVNIGDLLQLMSNGKLKSVNHRVVSKRIGPRISVACLLRSEGATIGNVPRVFGPFQELISEDCQPVYRNITLTEYHAKKYSKGLNGSSVLDHFKL
ncbi:unnamed protein product [Rhodiola kirilowii]